MMMLRAVLGAGLLLLALSTHVGAGPEVLKARFESGIQQVALIELYTSEGCSSCPPADRWLSGLKSDPVLWKDFVPVAFHVDYWDYIGWEDRFARPEYSQRQRRYVAEGRARTVYTPGFFRNGDEWRGWFRGERPSSDAAPVGLLGIELAGDQVLIHFAPRGEQYRELMVHVALLGMGVESRVNSGENEGKTLRHDFIALELISRPLAETDDGFSASAPLPGPGEAAGQQALVAWVSRPGDQAPIQAVGGFL